MTTLPLQTRASVLRARLEGREGSPQALVAIAHRWISSASAECSVSNPNEAEVKVALAQATIAMMELASRLDFDLLAAVTAALTRREMELPPPPPKLPLHRIKNAGMGVSAYTKTKEEK